MIYFTGDIHGDPSSIVSFANKMSLTKKDTIVILGDVGANYFLNYRDEDMKSQLSSIEPSILCVHGNHEIRPENINTYQLTDWNGGKVWFEDKYPNIFFAKDGEIFDIEGHKYIIIGGAYSVDKFYRIMRNYGWWADEQPSQKIKDYVETQLANNDIEVILSHTCPFKYEPTEMFLSHIDQSTVDTSTEEWLDKLEEHLVIRLGCVAIGIPTRELTRYIFCSTVGKHQMIFSERMKTNGLLQKYTSDRNVRTNHKRKF